MQWPLADQHGDVTWKDINTLVLTTSPDFYKSTTEIALGPVPIIGQTPDWLIGIMKTTQGYELITSKTGSDFTKTKFISSKGDQTLHKSISFSILESTPTTLFVDVMASSVYNLPLPFGTLYISDSSGGNFVVSLEHTNRDLSSGLVDVEHIQSTLYQGVILANIVVNFKDLEERKTNSKILNSVMSFDNGRRWDTIKAPTKDSKGNPYICTQCFLHLHSVSTSDNIGRVFSVSSSPGTILGVGNVGDSLHSYEDCDTFISNDSGVSWQEVQKGSFKFEILDFGSTIALVPDGKQKSDFILYSKNRGLDWVRFDFLVDGSNWVPFFTVLDAESTDRSLLLSVAKESKYGDKYMVHVDFETVFSRKCNSDQSSSNKDLELYKLESRGGNCVLGSSISHYRRKSDADCYVDSKFDPKPVIDSVCKCTDFDYECDQGFIPNGDKCISVNEDQPLDCKKGNQYLGSSGYRLIPGNKCKGGNDKKADKIMKDCQDKPGSKPKTDPTSSMTLFNSHIIILIQIPNTAISTILTKNGEVYRSTDYGQTFKKVEVPGDEKVLHIQNHATLSQRMFLYTFDKVYISEKAFEDSMMLLKTPEP